MNEYQKYKEANDVKKKKEYLDSLSKSKPTWNGGDYQKALADSLNNVANREKFTYDVNQDPLFQQYKDLYQSQGKLAMQNTMGQAAALTGGYGNSYATTAGNQAYQAYLQNLMQIVPELKNAARSEYDAETNRLNNLYSLYSDAYNRQYGEYNDKVSEWWNEKNFAYGDYRDTLNFDYGKYSDDLNYNYQVGRDKVADEQWQKQYNLSVANSNKSGGSSGGGGSSRSSSSSKSGSSKKQLTDAQYTKLKEAWIADGYTAGENVDALAENYEYLGLDITSALDNIAANNKIVNKGSHFDNANDAMKKPLHRYTGIQP